MKQHDQQDESRNAQSLAVATALALLGVSVGVNVPELLAASPAETMQAEPMKPGSIQTKVPAVQDKLPSVQDKERGSIQPKFPSTQGKVRGTPGMKPVGPTQ
jgi:hypothetical protein